jgi:DNA-binding CsgD family transcriptional regulator
MNSNLTIKQIEIVDAVATGRTIKEVADYLGKAPQTVFNMLSVIYDRLRIPHNLSALAVWRICTTNNIELPEFIRRCGAAALLVLFLTTIGHHGDVWRKGTRARENEMEVAFRPEI